MRAMVLRESKSAENHPLTLEDIPQPEPATRQVRISVQVCGVCHTDLHTVEGDIRPPRFPIVPGHQVIGKIEAIGAGVHGFNTGDLVGVPWLYSVDGTCAFCERGQENLCASAQFTGFHVNGGYAENIVVPAESAYRIPSNYDPVHAAPLLCGGVIGYRAYRLSEARPGDTLALYGFGSSAHIVLQMASQLGCAVYVFSRTPAHQQLAMQLGAAWAGEASQSPPQCPDSAIIFAPAGALVPQALRTVRRGGTVVLAGITMTELPQMPYDLLYHERVLRSVANSTRLDVREFLEVAASTKIETTVETFPLEQANESLVALKHSRINGAAVLRITA